ncbi:MAPEG family protein [Legionella sp. km772]|uniref:MAPEG family protein n=1 Tax=Legionella sp. km772 TaxID=2498111 RepID=UPI000F8F120E|nr:MAPEG family protein [Legionella sp. km772]RUR13718.1 MAPEG family protein [Legionella sp. km772]
MTTLLACLLIMLILPYLAKLPLGYAMNKLGGYDNNQPREQQAKLTGFGARALAAHQNSFEALSVFATAILAAIATQHSSLVIQILAIIYVISRVAYHVLYLMDLASLRSLTWFIGYICCLLILIQCFY